jgi:hypothetical protein
VNFPFAKEKQMSEKTERCRKCGENQFYVNRCEGKGEQLEVWCSSCGALLGFMLPDYGSGDQTRWRFIASAK